MVFFDLKTTCGICNNETGLNRYKVKKSNVWICAKCLKKAGGFTNVNVSKNTIEEIKQFIDDNENKANLKQELIIDKPLQIAEGMYKYCLDNKFGSGFNENWGIKHFRVLENNLMNDEEVKMAFIGLHNYKSGTKHDGYFAYAVTNKRIILGQKQTIAGEKFNTVSLNNINDITFKSGLMFGIVTIDTIKETFNVALSKNFAKAVNTRINEVIEEVKGISVNKVRVSNNTSSVADEILKFKELLDMGAITQDEFDAKKKQLLNI